MCMRFEMVNFVLYVVRERGQAFVIVKWTQLVKGGPTLSQESIRFNNSSSLDVMGHV